MEQHSPEQAAIYSGDLPVPKGVPDQNSATTLIQVNIDLFGSCEILKVIEAD